jgi:hypothetical protein
MGQRGKKLISVLLLAFVLFLNGCSKAEPYHGRYVFSANQALSEMLNDLYRAPFMHGQKPTILPDTKVEIILAPGNNGTIRLGGIETRFKYIKSANIIRVEDGPVTLIFHLSDYALTWDSAGTILTFSKQ